MFINTKILDVHQVDLICINTKHGVLTKNPFFNKHLAETLEREINLKFLVTRLHTLYCLTCKVIYCSKKCLEAKEC